MRLSKLAKVLSLPDENGDILVTFNGVHEVRLEPSELEEIIEFLNQPSNPGILLADDGRMVWIEMDLSVLAIFNKVALKGCERVRPMSGFAYAAHKDDPRNLSEMDARHALRYWEELDDTIFAGALRLLIDAKFLEQHPEVRGDPEKAVEEVYRCPAPLMPYRRAEVPEHGTLFLFERHIKELREKKSDG